MTNTRYFNYHGTPDNIQVFLDMDGVFSNFEGYFLEKLGKPTSELSGNELWGYIGKEIADGNPVFENFEPFKYVEMIWEVFKKYNPIFLSSTGFSNFQKIATQKQNWLNKHIGKGTNTVALFTKLSKNKAKYAYPNAILIDDREKSLGPWREAGGIGVKWDSKNPVNSMADFLEVYLEIKDKMQKDA